MEKSTIKYVISHEGTTISFHVVGMVSPNRDCAGSYSYIMHAIVESKCIKPCIGTINDLVIHWKFFIDLLDLAPSSEKHLHNNNVLPKSSFTSYIHMNLFFYFLFINPMCKLLPSILGKWRLCE